MWRSIRRAMSLDKGSRKRIFESWMVIKKIALASPCAPCVAVLPLAMATKG